VRGVGRGAELDAGRVAGAGVVLMLLARFGLRSAFFSIPRESSPR